ncbi:iron-containing alcohol dehydrogenase [Fusobacterium ulcerans]|uniref:iron-containing alcohol dehydrogenase n=1 Tax=Fusobacterium ulcerans TaxID=861 RepID=UPI0026F08A3F|nr:iron-containing alcohol dehydrogenase [Fusobacterium ulcerans]
MKNFNYNVSTKILFGTGKVDELGNEVKKIGSKVLLVYGKGSIKKNGLYDKVIEVLKREEITIFELPNVDPNPRIECVYYGAEICKREGIELVLAIGGGSTIDCAKAIAAQSRYNGDVWEDLYVKNKIKQLTSALPVASVLTLAATGSEMNGNSVISNMNENRKLSIGIDLLRPVFSILDPIYTYSVNKYQTAAGTADIMSHIFEQYFSPDHDGFLQNRLMEGLLKTIIHFGPIAYNEPENYEARANLMWGSSLALNGLLTYGKISTDWATHGMEHELSAYHDITHGVGLAILTPVWMEYVLSDENVHRFEEYGKYVWDISGDDPMAIAKEAINKTREFFKSLNIPSTLQEVGIKEENLEKMADAAVAFGPLGTMKKLHKADVLEILKRAF